MNCEGNCVQEDGEHKGEVKTVHVVYDRGTYPKDWGNFRYCEAAVEEDCRRGFTVTEVM